MSGLQYPIYVLGGFLFPVALLPEGLRAVSYLLPPYWAAAALHGTSSGVMGGFELLRVWTALALTGLILAFIAVRVFNTALDKARREGRLGWF